MPENETSNVVDMEAFAEQFKEYRSPMLSLEPQVDNRDISEKLSSLERQVTNLTSFLNLVFDGHVLINGRFVDIRSIVAQIERDKG